LNADEQQQIFNVLHTLVEKYGTYTAVNGQIQAVYAPYFIVIQAGVLRPFVTLVDDYG
jgi:hypothetical protein